MPADEIGIVTIYGAKGAGDWDVLVGANFDANSRSVSGVSAESRSPGTIDEIAIIDLGDSAWQTVVVWPKSNYPSSICIIYHRIDKNKLLSDAIASATIHYLIAQLFVEDGASEADKDNVGRAVALGLSALRGRNLGEVGYDVAMNEISTQLKNILGAGSWLTGFGVSYFSGYLEGAYKYSKFHRFTCK